MNRTNTLALPELRRSGFAALIAELFEATPLGILLAARRKS